MTFTPAKTLSDRSYVGLVLSQFLAAFNDQAIHIVAIFYASDLLHGFVKSPYFDQKLIVSIVTACFISPFFFFSPLAGILADKYSKQRTIVFWKFAEVAITGLALFGFLLPHLAGGFGMDMKTAATTASFLLIASVFLMGTHSAFFVPAKYGIMPELLHNSVLSRGNGLLEGTSFVSQILGTSFGGYLYFFFKSRPDAAAIDTGGLRLGQEWIIGLTLFVLAFLGAAFSLLVARIPAASPDRKLTLNPITPLAKNFGELKRSRPLVLATIGIAFFTFMTLFLRQTLLFQGETTKELNAARARLTQSQSVPNLVPLADAVAEQPTAHANEAHQLDELWIATLVALLGFGVGVGCAMAGKISGSRLELGLVPIGATLLICLTTVLAFVTGPPKGLAGGGTLLSTLAGTAAGQWPTIICLIAIGFAAGLYIVPLYTMLQHRAPKDSKGNMVATSNFVNVTGGLLAILMFYCVTFVFQTIQGNQYHAADVSAADLPAYVKQLELHQSIPRMLFLFAAGTTLLVLIAFQRMRPDFLLRTLSFFRDPRRRSLRAVGADHMPSYGPLLVVSNARTLADWLNIVSVLDRSTRFAWRGGADDALLKSRTVRSGVGVDLPQAEAAARKATLNAAQATLNAGDLFGATIVGSDSVDDETFRALAATTPELRILPVYVGVNPKSHAEDKPLASGAIPDEAAPVHAYVAPRTVDDSGATTVVVGDALPAAGLKNAVDALAELGG